jgi:integrase
VLDITEFIAYRQSHGRALESTQNDVYRPPGVPPESAFQIGLMSSPTLKPYSMAAVGRLPSASPGQRDTYLHPTIPGLILRVTDKGAKTFAYEARIKGVSKVKMTIGRYPTCTVDAAETAAKRIASQFVAGQDPRKAKPTAMKFADAVAWYLDQPGRRKASTVQHYQWLFQTYLAGLARKSMASISRGDLRALHARLTAENGPYVANRALVLVRSVYNAAIKAERYDGDNPASALALNREASREVRLLPSQLQGFITAIESYPDPAIRDFFQLCLLTGQRKSNVMAMRWDDLHLEDALWLIPETKNGRPQSVPLLAAELDILSRRKAETKGPWVFPSHGRSGHLVEPKNAWRSILVKAGLEPGQLRIHDLRRTLGSLMVDSGASLPTIGKTLGHLSQQTTSVYARLALDPVREAKAKAHELIARQFRKESRPETEHEDGQS